MCFTEEIKPDVPNQTLADIEARAKAEEQQAEAERRQKEAKEELERIQREAEEERERARALQEEANKAAEKAREEMERVKMEMAEANERAMKAQAEAEAAAASAREDAEKLVQQAAEERERARQAEEEARRVEAATREEAQRVMQAAEEERQRAKLAQVEAEKAVAVAAEEARKAIAAKQEAELQWKKGIRPVVTPSLDELERAKERIQYQEGYFHFAVTGVAGSGKSSLVNAFRGLRNRDDGAAATGVTETTLQTARYPDPSPNHQLLWFDVPGAGTLKVPDWQYFNEHGLYVFDCIIVLFDARFTLTDIAILSNARRFNIPAYIVRSKADQHIRNIMRDMGYNSDDDDEEDDPGRRNRFYKAARKQYIEETRRNIKANLENTNLPDQQVYLVSNDTMLSCVTTQRMPKKVIDEIELLSDIFAQVVSRRSLHKHDALSSTVIPSMVSATSFASMLPLPTLSH
ncbi:interferon-inducible GTPase-domain-containing protein [Pisolithus sp. B1]|nr:interferon-inducible GTPase-domain-containing protein [Pisolithus sp. B1]